MLGLEKKNPIDRLEGEKRLLAVSLARLSPLEIREIAYAAAGLEPHIGPFRDTVTAKELFESLRGRNIDLLLPDFSFLHALKQPLYDTVVVWPEQTIEDVLFILHQKFADGTHKTLRDSNLLLGGQLGHPLQFDIEALEIRFEEFGEPEDVRRFLSGTAVTWFYDSNTPELRLTASGFDPHCLGSKMENPDIEKTASRLVKAGLWPIYRKEIRKKTIMPMENFRLHFQYDRPLALSAPLRVKALMVGTLWR